MIDTDRIDYVRALTRAILEWTEAEVARNPEAFRYGTADLAGAARRIAHFRFVRYDPLYVAFRNSRHADAVSAEAIKLEYSWLDGLVRHVVAQRPCKTYVRRSQRMAELLWRLLPTLIKYRRWRSRARPARKQAASSLQPAVLFYAPSPKLWRFLTPLRAALQNSGVPAAFGTAVGMPARFYLAHDTPCVAGGLGPRRRRIRNRHPVVFQLRLEYDRVLSELATLRPGCVVVSEGCHSIDSLVQEAARELGIASVCLQQGWAPIQTVGFMDMRFDSFVAWGEGFAEQLRPLNPEQRFDVLGNHVIPAGATRDEAWRKLDTPKRQAVAVALQPDVNAIPAGTCRAMIEMVARLARAHPDQRFLVREHPNERVTPQDRAILDGLINVSWNDPREVPLFDFLGEAAVIVAGSSTTLLEGTCVGAVPVVVSVRPGNRHNPDVAAAGAGIQADSIQEAEAKITRMIADEAWRRSFREPMRTFAAHYFHQDGDPLDRIVAHIEALASRGHAS